MMNFQIGDNSAIYWKAILPILQDSSVHGISHLLGWKHLIILIKFGSVLRSVV